MRISFKNSAEFAQALLRKKTVAFHWFNQYINKRVWPHEILIRTNLVTAILVHVTCEEFAASCDILAVA